MTEIIGVRFKSGGKQYYFDPKGIQVEPGQGVIVETAKGIEYGECLKGNTMVEDEAVVAPLRPIMQRGAQPQYLLPVRFLGGGTPYDAFAPRENIRIKKKGGGSVRLCAE